MPQGPGRSGKAAPGPAPDREERQPARERAGRAGASSRAPPDPAPTEMDPSSEDELPPQGFPFPEAWEKERHRNIMEGQQAFREGCGLGNRRPPWKPEDEQDVRPRGSVPDGAAPPGRDGRPNFPTLGAAKASPAAAGPSRLSCNALDKAGLSPQLPPWRLSTVSCPRSLPMSRSCFWMGPVPELLLEGPDPLLRPVAQEQSQVVRRVPQLLGPGLNAGVPRAGVGGGGRCS